ncbi:hypothetical protein [Neobacillus niacini]|nr:hypothetical protein [Neobacillus niacini]KGM44906.1 hypothetical protein NP83_08880 [Neobacillus niacini]
MSLSRISLQEVVKKQYSYKFRSYIQVFLSLVFIQMLGILFSFNGVGMAGTSSSTFEIDIHFYSSDIVVIFTMLWAFITSILITTQAYRNDDFAFITNRLSSNLSNMLFLLTISMVGGLTALLSSHVIRILMYVLGRSEYLYTTTDVSEWIIGFIATVLYILICSAVGYFFGTLVQLHKVFAVLLPVAFFGILIVGAGTMNETIIQEGFEFIFKETSLAIFIVKIGVLAALLFTGSALMSNRMEVR